MARWKMRMAERCKKWIDNVLKFVQGPVEIKQIGSPSSGFNCV
jgi:hypothetical protein